MTDIREELLPSLHGDDRELRVIAADELVTRGAEAVPALLDSLENDPRPTWKQTILVLKQIRDPRALPILRGLTRDTDPLIRVLAGSAVKVTEANQPKPQPAVSFKKPPPVKPTPPPKPRLRAKILDPNYQPPPPKPSPTQDPFERRVHQHLRLFQAPDYTAKGDAVNFFKLNAARAIPILEPLARTGNPAAAQMLTTARNQIGQQQRQQRGGKMHKTGLF